MSKKKKPEGVHLEIDMNVFKGTSMAAELAMLPEWAQWAHMCLVDQTPTPMPSTSEHTIAEIRCYNMGGSFLMSLFGEGPDKSYYIPADLAEAIQTADVTKAAEIFERYYRLGREMGKDPESPISWLGGMIFFEGPED